MFNRISVVLAFSFMACVGASSPGCDCSAHAYEKGGMYGNEVVPHEMASEAAAPAKGCIPEIKANKACPRWYELFEKEHPDACIPEARQFPGMKCHRWYVMQGEPVTAVIRTNLIHFAFNKSNILPKSYPILNEIVSSIKEADVTRVTIEGHTDSKGSDEYNLKLSDRRAASVREYLSSHGIPDSKMNSVGKGESTPVAENEINGKDNSHGRALNRRVEFHLQLKPGANAKVIKGGESSPIFP